MTGELDRVSRWSLIQRKANIEKGGKMAELLKGAAL
jgi:hypothetical protein